MFMLNIYAFTSYLPSILAQASDSAIYSCKMHAYKHNSTLIMFRNVNLHTQEY